MSGLSWIKVSGEYAANTEWWLVNADGECKATVLLRFGTGFAEYNGRRFLNAEAAKAVALREVSESIVKEGKP